MAAAKMAWQLQKWHGSCKNGTAAVTNSTAAVKMARKPQKWHGSRYIIAAKNEWQGSHKKWQGSCKNGMAAVTNGKAAAKLHGSCYM